MVSQIFKSMLSSDAHFRSRGQRWIILTVALAVMTGCYSYSPPKKKVWGFVDGVTAGVYYDASTNEGFVGKCGKVTSEPIDHPKNDNILHFHSPSEGNLGIGHCTFMYPDDFHSAPYFQTIYYRFSYHQIREDEFVIHATSSSNSGKKNEGEFERFILIVTAAIGDHEGFKYGIFDQVSTTVDRDPGETVTTSRGTGMAGTAYGLYFGSDQSTTTTKMVDGTLTIERRHHVKFYRSKPVSDAYLDLALLMNSIVRGSDYKLTFY